MRSTLVAFTFLAMAVPPSPTYRASIIDARLEGRATKSGEKFSSHAYVCAMKRDFAGVPEVWGEWWKITTTTDAPERTVFVRRVDRLPDTAASDIDLSPAAARLLFPEGRGVAIVRVERMRP